MIELIRANDVVLIGFARSILEAAEIPVLVADSHMSLMEGSIGVFGQSYLTGEPQKLMQDFVSRNKKA